MSDMEAVKARYPEAVVLNCHEVAGDYNVYSEDSGRAEYLGCGRSIVKAWANARALLETTPAKLTPREQ